MLSIIECDLWWANLPPFQLTDDAVIGAGYSLPNASVMGSYGVATEMVARRGVAISLVSVITRILVLPQEYPAIDLILWREHRIGLSALL
jgi:hypothetical protein